MCAGRVSKTIHILMFQKETGKHVHCMRTMIYDYRQKSRKRRKKQSKWSLKKERDWTRRMSKWTFLRQLPNQYPLQSLS